MVDYLNLPETSALSCRICLGEDTIDNLLVPCRCSGSMKYVHYSCLVTWMQETTNEESKIKCEICNVEYQRDADRSNIFFQKFTCKNEYFFYVYNFVIILLMTCIHFIDTESVITRYIEPNIENDDTFIRYIVLYSFCSICFIFLLWTYLLIGILSLKSSRGYLFLFKKYSCLIRLSHIVVISLFITKEWLASIIVNNWVTYMIHNTHLESLQRIIPEETIVNYDPDNEIVEI